LYRANSGFTLPNCWVSFYSPSWWSGGVILTVVDLVYIGNRNLSPSILETLQNILRREVSTVGKDVRIVHEAKDLIRNLEKST
jgi:hypothetical protein